ncbi:MAG: peptide deformylase [Synechococcaceae bacterium WB8_1B_057]|nr:peptide deformylase [Synechococcaceae bacterium WB6_1A_059]NDG79816.1 peptide deformylase [Synechococcaceae bacterium WB8_1B_057]
MFNIITFPNDILRIPLPTFDFNNLINTLELEKNMLQFMYDANGIGLAANQIGLSYRVFVMGHKDNPELGKAFFNPIVISCTETISEMEEGCLSFPNTYVKVKRPSAIKAKWQNYKGEWEEGEFRGYDCKCFLHELDHLEGIVFKDRVSNLKWNRANKRKR